MSKSRVERRDPLSARRSQWRVSDVRKRMRLALEQILPPTPMEGV